MGSFRFNESFSNQDFIYDILLIIIIMQFSIQLKISLFDLNITHFTVFCQSNVHTHSLSIALPHHKI